jgi:hypothetical protein
VQSWKAEIKARRAGDKAALAKLLAAREATKRKAGEARRKRFRKRLKAA